MRVLEPCLNNTSRPICADFQRATSGSQNSPEGTTGAAGIFRFTRHPPRTSCDLAYSRGTLRGVGWRPPGRRGVGGKKPALFTSRCSRTTNSRQILLGIVLGCVLALLLAPLWVPGRLIFHIFTEHHKIREFEGGVAHFNWF